MEMLAIALIVLVAFAAVLVPLLRRRGDGSSAPEHASPDAAAADDAGAATPASGESAGDEAIEQEVLRYREAVRADTVCGKCGQANPPDSAYCFECGARLPRADAKEFE